MEAIFTPEFFNTMLIVMAAVGLVVFISLYFVDAGAAFPKRFSPEKQVDCRPKRKYFGTGT